MLLSVTYTIYFNFKREIISLLINQSTLYSEFCIASIKIRSFKQKQAI